MQVPSWHILPTLAKVLSATRFLLAKTSISPILSKKAVSRDNFIAANSDGGLYWIFRDHLDAHWYVQDIFA